MYILYIYVYLYIQYVHFCVWYVSLTPHMVHACVSKPEFQGARLQTAPWRDSSLFLQRRHWHAASTARR